MLQTLTFFALAGLVTIFALGTLVLRNMFHTFLSFLGCLLSVAGVFFSLQADFIGGVQVIVYAGSVAVLIVLALLLINHKSGDLSRTNLWSHKWLGGVIAAVLVGGALFSVIMFTHFTGLPLTGETAAIEPVPYIELADGLLNQYPVAFEAMAMLLLAALVAAIITTQADDKADKKAE